MNRRIFTGKSVQEATAVALEALDVELEDVDIRVVNPGRAGIFGLGGALAEIEVAKITDLQDETQTTETRKTRTATQSTRRQTPPRERPKNRTRASAKTNRVTSNPSQAETASDRDSSGQRPKTQTNTRERSRASASNRSNTNNTTRRNRQPAPPRRRGNASSNRSSASTNSRAQTKSNNRNSSNTRAQSQTTNKQQQPATIENRQELEELTGEILSSLISSMNVQVDAYVMNELRDGSLVFEIEGPDAGLLIGRHGDTLRDLQFITRLLVSRRLTRRANITIDVEQYQLRRITKLESMAKNAARAASRGSKQTLEPMTPDERRIIHMTLSDNPQVTTESQGQGSDRHVVVKPRSD